VLFFPLLGPYRRGTQKLDLKTRYLESIPASVFECTALTWLGLNGNTIRELPAALGALTQLKVLRLLSNRVEVLGAHLGRLHQLTVLDVGKNRLTTVEPGSLSGLTGLKVGSDARPCVFVVISRCRSCCCSGTS
jgi:Leucine-rich repeat (LRR) protein